MGDSTCIWPRIMRWEACAPISTARTSIERLYAAGEVAMPANGDIDLGMLQHVAEVERAGNVRRRNYEREYAAGAPGGRAEDPGVDPPLRPMRLEPLRLVDFLNLHGEITS